MFAALKYQARGLPDLERELRRDQTIGTASNPVRPEIFAAHSTPSIAATSPTTRRETANARLPWRARGYNASEAKMASKNMMNHYRRPSRNLRSNLLL